MADSTSTTLCEMNGRALEDQRDREAQSCHGGHRVLVKVQDLDHMARHSLNWEEFFGSSLDLAPSLLNIYDDIAASGGRLPEKEDSEEEDFQEETFQKVVKTQSLPFKTNGQWSSEGVRPGILPSLSEPGDRPVSCLVSNWAPATQHADSKKRPLSLSSPGKSLKMFPATRSARKRCWSRGRPASCSGSYTSTPVTTPESGHRRTRPSRQEARKRFFSNYEEHMRNAMSDLEPAVLASSQPQSTASPSETLLVHDKVPSKPSLPLQAEIMQDERRTPPQLTRKGEGHGDRESPSHITRRSEGRGGSRKERHASPKTNFTKSMKRKDAGSNRDSSEVSGTGYITYVQRVVTEIIESERIYISSLKDIIQ
uniref:DH domain-containing protein n=1 Tax=Biomphalaria glabrata TaxID=6526 RepID=A0A2C9KVM4_BIOGL